MRVVFEAGDQTKASDSPDLRKVLRCSCSTMHRALPASFIFIFGVAFQREEKASGIDIGNHKAARKAFA